MSVFGGNNTIHQSRIKTSTSQLTQAHTGSHSQTITHRTINQWVAKRRRQPTMANDRHHPPTPTAADVSVTPTLYRQNASLFLARCAAHLEETSRDDDVSGGGSGSDGARRIDDPLISWVGDAARSLALRAASQPPLLPADTTSSGQAGGGTSVRKKKKKRKSRALGDDASAEDVLRALPPDWSDFVCMASII